DPSSSVHAWLEQHQRDDSRIKILRVSTPTDRAVALNRALTSAVGEFVAPLDQHDTLAPHALSEVVRCIQKNVVDVFYSDEDEIDANGVRSAPFFKPDWSPDLCLSSVYACHFNVYRRSLVETAGGFQPQYGEGMHYDLLLRCTERSERIAHIPRVLYHRRQIH